MKPSGDRSYKRSWKNLLINKRYQLSFTLFMVGLATVLMIGLGIYVMHVANETTTVSKTLAQGRRCAQIPTIDPPYEETSPVPTPTMKLPDDDKQPATAPAEDAAGSGSAAAPSGERRRPKIDVTLDAMELPKPQLVVPPVPANWKESVVAHYACELNIANAVGELEAGRMRILYVLIATGFFLVMGLAAYGIKMTHRVAGPLFKVQLYFAKMRDGRFDKVYNLRKGDQLVDFYDHFKHAHAGVVAAEKGDVARIKKLIEAAEAAGAGEHAAVAQLRELLARKEKALE